MFFLTCREGSRRSVGRIETDRMTRTSLLSHISRRIKTSCRTDRDGSDDWGQKTSFWGVPICDDHCIMASRQKPPRARRRARMALNLASGNFDARPTAGLARASACSTEPVPASQHPCMQLLNDRWTHGAARAHVHRTIHPTTELFIPFTGSDAS